MRLLAHAWCSGRRVPPQPGDPRWIAAGRDQQPGDLGRDRDRLLLAREERARRGRARARAAPRRRHRARGAGRQPARAAGADRAALPLQHARQRDEPSPTPTPRGRGTCWRPSSASCAPRLAATRRSRRRSPTSSRSSATSSRCSRCAWATASQVARRTSAGARPPSRSRRCWCSRSWRTRSGTGCEPRVEGGRIDLRARARRATGCSSRWRTRASASAEATGGVGARQRPRAAAPRAHGDAARLVDPRRTRRRATVVGDRAAASRGP
ncbi:MAG: hypothetical protein MZW92_12095 [Comamonadaceae bacterium]|nr:hypothetical protein [Comamonadaceae bacterium]